jgi:sugar lactone lactonase YvrE
MLQHMRLPNGLDWSPNGKTFYLIDSLARSVEVFDFDAVHGTIDNRRTRTLDWGPGGPNGMTVDREGCLWVAVTGTSEVRCYAPDGELRARVMIGTPGATSCAFGGADSRVLFITSRRGRAPDIALKMGVAADKMEDNSPAAGGLFVCQPGARGVPATPFAA